MKKIKIILFFLFFYLIFNIEGKSHYNPDISDFLLLKELINYQKLMLI